MKKIARIGILIIAIALIPSLFLPLWKIDLQAPQYPEGLEMKIWLNHLSGNISIINGLNHYIGMKNIVESDFPELKYMLFCVIAVSLLSLLTFIINKKWLLYATFGIFLIMGIYGFTDFYHWEYVYGHHLNPHAAIKIPGMSYQPPFLGAKQLLNFTAYSYPDIGGFFVLSAGGLLLLITLYELVFHGSLKAKKIITSRLSAAAAIFIVLLLVRCTPSGHPLDYGNESCQYCKMGITDKHFGGEIITGKGKVYEFDCFECMVNFAKVYTNNIGDNAKFLVTDASRNGELTDAKSAIYLLSHNFPSPMGAYISAFADENEFNQFHQKYAGDKLTWNEARDSVLKNPY